MGVHVTGLSLDPDTKPLHWDLLQLKDVVDCRVDLRDAAVKTSVMQEHQPEIVFHLATIAMRKFIIILCDDNQCHGLINCCNLLTASSVKRCRHRQQVYALTKSCIRTMDIHFRWTVTLMAAQRPVPSWSRKSLAKKLLFRFQCVRLATVRAGNVIGGGDWAKDRLVPDS